MIRQGIATLFDAVRLPLTAQIGRAERERLRTCR
jgi:hypothetical protein